MAVYVDPAVWPFGRMMMCHMLADTVPELHEMARKLGLRRSWFQNRPGKTPHYDVCKSKRAEAIRLGAVEVSRERAVEIANLLKAGKPPASLSPPSPPPPIPSHVQFSECRAEQATFLL